MPVGLPNMYSQVLSKSKAVYFPFFFLSQQILPDLLMSSTPRDWIYEVHTAIPYRVEQGVCREVSVLKTGCPQCEQDPCNENRFSSWLMQVFPVRMWAQEIYFFITGTGFAVQSSRLGNNTKLAVRVFWVEKWWSPGEWVSLCSFRQKSLWDRTLSISGLKSWVLKLPFFNLKWWWKMVYLFFLESTEPLQRYLLTCLANSAFLGRFFCTGQQ